MLAVGAIWAATVAVTALATFAAIVWWTITERLEER